MCGIFGMLCDGIPKQINKMRESGDKLSKRGPDANTWLISRKRVCAFYRLAINDLSMNGMQPFISKNEDEEIILLCNGEIYNHKELRKAYSLECKSDSDCEVILELYKKIGFQETVKKLYGVFAIILIHNNSMYIARDRIGVRPLYYGFTEEGFLAVASTPDMLLDFCTDVSHFNPGCFSLYHNNSFTMTPFITVDLPLLRISTQEDVRKSLIEAVKLRLLSDRPMCCLLSGGLDSSLVASILVRLLGKQNVRTYSIGMEGSTDLKYAKIVAEYLGTNHTQVLFTPYEGFAVIPTIIKTLATYDITTIRASVGMFLLAKYISENTDDKVIFSGEGADEVLQGYLYFHNAPTCEEGELESINLLRNMHLYDVLRADRCISANGLEPRVPFLDKNFIDTCLSLPVKEKCPQFGYEKYVLRKAFEDGFLPEKVLWRRKEGFSDGVSSLEKSWYQHIQEFSEPLITDSEFIQSKLPSKEACYYKKLFSEFFPTYNLQLPYWMPKWSKTNDPSGRTLTVYDEKKEV